MREASLLRQRYQAILSHSGLVVSLCAALMLAPLVALLIWPEEGHLAWHFLMPALLMGGLGIATWRAFRSRERIPLSIPEGGVIVLLSWGTVCLWSAWPLAFGHGLGLTQALFESVSGWTTTGLSVVDVAHTSHAILLWRSSMQLAGGAGLAIIMLSAITRPTGPALSSAEGREQLVPNVRQSARLVLTIYSGYVLIGVVALRLAGMNGFDAVNHAFCAVSTGGFSTRPESIGYWNSTVVEAVTLALMVLGNLSFITAWLLMHRRFRAAARDGEVRLFALVAPVCIALLFLLTCRGLYPSLGKSVRVAIFEAVSALTTTGYSTVGYSDWNAFGWVILIVLMVIGGGTCSTAGGIKQYRVYLLWKSIVWEVRRALAPRDAVLLYPVQEADREIFISEQRLWRIGTFVFLYLLTLAIGTAVMTAYGYGIRESAFEYASSLGTVGLSVGVTSANTPPVVLWVQMVGMLLGRLEFFVILASIAKILRDAPRMMRGVPPIR